MADGAVSGRNAAAAPGAPSAGGGAPAVLRLQALAYAWPDGTVVFEGLDAAVLPGLTLVQGGDGRGKTTLLRLMAGELEPTRGKLERAAAAVCWHDPRDPADDARGVDDCLAAERARRPGWDQRRCEALLEGFGMRPHRGKRLAQLSTGSRRKVWLIAALAGGAPLILLDTPFASLDGPSRVLLGVELARIADEGRQALVITDFVCPAGLGDRLAGVIDLGD